jgi:hypothetical protein
MITILEQAWNAPEVNAEGETVAPGYWQVTAYIVTDDGSCRAGERLDLPETATVAELIAAVRARWNL